MKKKELKQIINKIYQENGFLQLDNLTDEQREQVILNLFVSKEEFTNPDVFKSRFGIHIKYEEMKDDYLAKTYIESDFYDTFDKVIILNRRLVNGKTEEEKKDLEEWIHFSIAYEFIYLLLNHHRYPFNYDHWLRDSYLWWEDDVVDLIGCILLDLKNISLSNPILVEKGLEELSTKHDMPKRFVKNFKKIYDEKRRK